MAADPITVIIEDDPILMMSLVEFVEQADCEAIEANSVREAIEILETRTDIRTAFTDLDMRGSTAGMQLALSIRDRWPRLSCLWCCLIRGIRARSRPGALCLANPLTDAGSSTPSAGSRSNTSGPLTRWRLRHKPIGTNAVPLFPAGLGC